MFICGLWSATEDIPEDGSELRMQSGITEFWEQWIEAGDQGALAFF